MEKPKKKVFDRYGVISAVYASGFYSGLNLEAWNVDVQTLYDYTVKLENAIFMNGEDLNKLETRVKVRSILFDIARQMINNRIANGEHRFNEMVKLDDLFDELLQNKFSIEPVCSRK